ncbi:MAG: thiamine diphosphokinase [Longicatena sp.]
MRKIILVAGMSDTLIYDETYDYIGVDHGAFVCMELGIPLVAAIGDFDSISEEVYQQLVTYTNVEKLPAQKNETDSEEAIHYAMNLGYEEIILYGGLGGRMDHELANLHLMIHRRLPITLMDRNNILKVLLPGEYTIQKEHKYLSFLALEESCISETGVAYPLYEQKLVPSDIYSISNEFEGQEAHIILHYGRMLMMQSDDNTCTGC